MSNEFKQTNFPVHKRNNMIADMLDVFTDDIIFLGDPSQPKIILDGKYCIFGFVKNYTYHFCDLAFRGNIVMSVDLFDNTTYPTAQQIDNMIKKYGTRKFVTIKNMSGDDDGESWFVNSVRGNEIFFSESDRRIFFSANKALNFIKKLRRLDPDSLYAFVDNTNKVILDKDVHKIDTGY